MATTPAPAAPYTDYSDLSYQEQNLYLEIQRTFGDHRTHEQVMEFIEELDEYGITTYENLQDAFVYCAEAYNEEGAKAEFAEYWYSETMGLGEAYDLVVVDWSATYDYSLRFDMFIIEFDGDYYFFNGNY